MKKEILQKMENEKKAREERKENNLKNKKLNNAIK